MWMSTIRRRWRSKRAVTKVEATAGLGVGESEKLESYTGMHVKDEHFVPSFGLDLEEYIARNDLTAVHHLIRYYWAVAVLSNWDVQGPVLDLGCGAGYGAFLLADGLPKVQVLGVDYDDGALQKASKAYQRPNLRFRFGDPLLWSSSMGDEEFETIVCFDVVEHVRHREILLEGIVAHLASTGRLFLSTPSGMPENTLKPGWPEHQIEYGTASLYDFLRRYFGRVHGSDQENFPERSLFTKLHERGISYVLKLNPVICSEPIRIANPYRG
jgi:2-polyprenyl-3-methyl-5-hydroxy-6-metoxy-1,4-benzoquinol methylase